MSSPMCPTAPARSAQSAVSSCSAEMVTIRVCGVISRNLADQLDAAAGQQGGVEDQDGGLVVASELAHLLVRLRPLGE